MNSYISEPPRNEPFIQLGAQRAMGKDAEGKTVVLDGTVYEVNKDRLPGVHQVQDRNRPGFAMMP